MPWHKPCCPVSAHTRSHSHTHSRSRRGHAHPGLHQLNSLARLFLLMQQIKLLYRRRKHTRHGVLWRSTQPRLLSSAPEGISFLRLPRLCAMAPASSEARQALAWGSRSCRPEHMAVIKTSRRRAPRCAAPPAPIPLGQNAARAVSRGCVTTDPRGRVPSEGLDHPGNAEEPLKTLEEPLAPPEVEEPWLCLGREVLYLCVCAQVGLCSRARHSHR